MVNPLSHAAGKVYVAAGVQRHIHAEQICIIGGIQNQLCRFQRAAAGRNPVDPPRRRKIQISLVKRHSGTRHVAKVRVSNNKGNFNAKNEQFSFDFAIIIENDDGSFITRRDAENHYTWNELPSKNSYIYKKFYSLEYDKQNAIIEKVINRKIKEKAKSKEKRITSSVIFMEEVNNYRG